MSFIHFLKSWDALKSNYVGRLVAGFESATELIRSKLSAAALQAVTRSEFSSYTCHFLESSHYTLAPPEYYFTAN